MDWFVQTRRQLMLPPISKTKNGYYCKYDAAMYATASNVIHEIMVLNLQFKYIMKVVLQPFCFTDRLKLR